MHAFFRRARDAIIWNAPIVGAKRFVAGTTMSAALAEAQKLQSEGFCTTINFLGEHALVKEDVHNYTLEYLKLIEAVSNAKLNASVSIKLTQLGLCFDELMCSRQLRLLLCVASDRNIFLELDREAHEFSEATQRIFREEAAAFPHRLRLCVQLNQNDAVNEALSHIERQEYIRICKGAYAGYYTTSELRARLRLVLRVMSALTAYDSGGKYIRRGALALATHDLTLLENARFMGPVEWFEIQMLRGIERNVARHLVREGFNVRLYVPYGPFWFAYGRRRWRSIVGIWWRNFRYRFSTAGHVNTLGH